MGLRSITIVRALLLAVVAVVAVLPAAVQEATPPAAATAEQQQVEIPDARILALSPDGQLLAARTPAEGRAEHLCVYEVATLAGRACANLDQQRTALADESVVWSPDSTKLAFSEEAFRYLVDGDLWLMDAASGELTNLTDDGFEGGLPFFGDDDEQPETPIYVDVLPAWAPDSQSITFSRSPIIGGQSRGNQIVRVDLASREVEILIPVTLDAPGVVYWGLVWAPDAQRLYYSVSHPGRDNPQNGVWAYDAATGQARHILRGDPELGPPAVTRISASGQTALVIYPYAITHIAMEGDGYALLDLETNALSPIHPVPSNPSSPMLVRVVTFSPDGTRVLYGLHRLEDGRGRFLVRDLPDGEPDAAVAEIDSPPMMTTIGGGLFWANDGTVFAATDINAGLLLHLDPGDVPTIPADGQTGSPDATPAASPTAGDPPPPGTTVALSGEASLRATPSTSGIVVLELRPGAELTVIGEAVEAGGSVWLPVIEPATGAIGYVDASLLA
ncbi:MAG: hypothetical protein ACRDJW_04270 [Thermomicrobiales bacterium]